MRVIALLLAVFSASAAAQVYRWVDKSGTVHYSNEQPPADVKPTQLPIDAKAGPPSADSQECYSVRCQGERMEERIARRDAAEAQAAAERAAATGPRPPGLAFRQNMPVHPGMREARL